MRDLVTVEGRCAGVGLDNLHLRGFIHCAVRFRGTTGKPDAGRIFLSRVRAEGTANSPTLLWFENAGQHVLVRYCRLEGFGPKASTEESACRQAIYADGPPSRPSICRQSRE